MNGNIIRESIEKTMQEAEVQQAAAEEVNDENKITETDNSGVSEAPVEPKEEEKNNDESGSVGADLSDEELKNIDPELREVLSKADAEVRKAQISAFKKMRSTFDRKMSEFGEDKKLAEEIKGELSKYGLKANPNDIKGLIAFDALYRTDPKKAVKMLAEQHKLAIAEEDQKAEEEEFYTPEEKKLLDGQKALQEEVKKLKEQQRLREQEESDRLVLNFKNEKDEKGNLKHPHFEAVADQMVALHKVNRNLSLKELYEQAVWINPDIRSQILENEKKRAIEERETKRKAEVEKAKSVSSQRIKSIPAKTQSLSVRDIIAQTVEQFAS